MRPGNSLGAMSNNNSSPEKGEDGASHIGREFSVGLASTAAFDSLPVRALACQA